jgi:hypothetical protein
MAVNNEAVAPGTQILAFTQFIEITTYDVKAWRKFKF